AHCAAGAPRGRGLRASAGALRGLPRTGGHRRPALGRRNHRRLSLAFRTLMPTRLRFPFALAALALSACADRPSVEYDGPYAREVRRAIPQLEKATGLKFTSPPRLEERDRDEVREFLERQFAEQLTPLELAGTEQAYKRFGMIPDTMDLRSFLLDLLTEQVAGYYDPETRVLYVVEGGSPEITSVTVSHELVHALQHMHSPLDSGRALKVDNYRQVAMQAMVEGQA